VGEGRASLRSRPAGRSARLAATRRRRPAGDLRARLLQGAPASRRRRERGADRGRAAVRV